MSKTTDTEQIYEKEQVIDEVLLVQATGFDKWFLDTLDAFKISWERIPDLKKWIQFEIPSNKLQWLIHSYSDVTIDILE